MPARWQNWRPGDGYDNSTDTRLACPGRQPDACAFGQALLEVAARDPKAVVLSADTQDLLGIRPYMARYPERFVEVGIAEQNAIGIASGLAITTRAAYVCGYAPFISARSMEQVRNDVAYAHQRVVIGAAASGISLGVSGGTHHALEDPGLDAQLSAHDGDRPG